jgi:putative transposase
MLDTGKMVEYRKSAHTVWDVKYHIAWITKYRYKVLRGEIAVKARDLLRQICQSRDVVIVQGAVWPAHIHLLVSVPPHLSPAKLVQYMKGRSSRMLQDEFPQLKKRYWGQHLWARGYFCASVGAVDEDTIRRYMENPQWDDPGENFKITAPTEP